jgi:hypothetical protein
VGSLRSCIAASSLRVFGFFTRILPIKKAPALLRRIDWRSLQEQVYTHCKGTVVLAKYHWSDTTAQYRWHLACWVIHSEQQKCVKQYLSARRHELHQTHPHEHALDRVAGELD